MNLAAACWPDVLGGADVVLVPLGSCEQHGPHLPMNADALIAEAVARAAGAVLRRTGMSAWCAPVVAFGASGEHQQFAGTLSIGHDALHSVLIELGRSACNWTTRLVFVNGHGGNLPTVATAVQQLRLEGRDVAWVPCQPPGADAHAGRSETSLLLAIAPSLVRLAAAQGGATDPIRELLPRLRQVGVVGVSPNGVLGDPAGASAGEGRTLLASLVADVVRAIDGGEVDARGRLLVRAGVT